MNKIKIIGIVILVLSVSLIFLSNFIDSQNKINTNIINEINEEKQSAQNISKHIFFVYRNRGASVSELNNLINKYINKIKFRAPQKIYSEPIKKQNSTIKFLLKDLSTYLQVFQEQGKMDVMYSSIIVDQIVSDIYHKNLKLAIQYDKLRKMYHKYFSKKLKIYKNLQNSLFFILILSLIYLFAQIKDIIIFIQKFLNTSKKIIDDSSIQNLEPIETKNNNNMNAAQLTYSFNFLVNKIDNSIHTSSNSIEHSYKSLETLEKNIEDLMELIFIMEDKKKINRELTKSEDAVIQSLEELTNSIENLKNLKIDLNNLISNYKK